MKLIKSFALTSVASAFVTGGDAELCQADSAADCQGIFCSWTGSSCQLNRSSLMSGQSAVQSEVNSVMAGMEISSLRNTWDANKSQVESNSRSMNLGFALSPFGNSFGNAMGVAMLGGNSFFECPLDVPFCERQSCVQAGFDFSNTESNAFACYSQPGCCFDEKLYAHRVAFGPNFFKSVPVCHRAIDNALFKQLATQVSVNGQFLPSFVQPLVDQVMQLMQNPLMEFNLRNFQGCAPKFGDPAMYNMLSQVSQGNYLIMTFAADESKYNNFFSTLTSSCGWNDIREDECALVGCCWNSATSVCENPLGTNISQERIQFAIQHVTLSQYLGGRSATAPGASQETTNQGTPPGVGGIPPVLQGLGQGSPRYRRNDDESRNGNMLQSLLLNQMNPGAGNGMQNIFALNGLAGGNTGLGGLGGLGMFGGGGLNGGIYGGGAWGGSSIQPNEMCAPVNVAKNCMAPSAIRGFDLMQKMSLERQCAAKGCCWDSTRYQQSLLMQPGNALGSAGNLMCAWRAPDYSAYGMPSLTNSLRGCCDYSPCVERRGRDGSRYNKPVQPTPAPTQPVPQDPPVWSEWIYSQCSKSCGGGYLTKYRDCLGGSCMNSGKQVINNVSCNQNIPCGSSWYGNFFG